MINIIFTNNLNDSNTICIYFFHRYFIVITIPTEEFSRLLFLTFARTALYFSALYLHSKSTDHFQDIRKEHSFSSSSHPSSQRLCQSEKISNSDMRTSMNGHNNNNNNYNNNNYNNNNNDNNYNDNNNNGWRDIIRSNSNGNERTYADVYGQDPLFNGYVSQLTGQSTGGNRGHFNNPNGGNSTVGPFPNSPGQGRYPNQSSFNGNNTQPTIILDSRAESPYKYNQYVDSQVEVELEIGSPVGCTDISVESGEEEEEIASVSPTPIIVTPSINPTDIKKKKSKRKNSSSLQK